MGLVQGPPESLCNIYCTCPFMWGRFERYGGFHFYSSFIMVHTLYKGETPVEIMDLVFRISYEQMLLFCQPGFLEVKFIFSLDDLNKAKVY